MAAGLGFKTFNTGDVLSAADVNGYLMQGVLVFANAAARDAAVTSPQEGQCCYLKDTDAVQTYSGSAWVGFDDSNAIQNSIVDAKGDIVAASGNDTPARLAVGSNGDTLVADSAATTGLRWQVSQAAGKNFVINGALQIWQRGTSFNNPASAYYTADRFQGMRHSQVSGITVSRQATGDTTNLPQIQYCARVSRDSGNTSTNALYFGTCLETASSIPLAGQAVTLSFYARKGANYSPTSDALTVKLISGTGTDQNNTFTGSYTGSADVISQTATLTSTWQRFTYTGTVGATATELQVLVFASPTGTAGAADYYEITGIQLERGSVATAFQTATGTIQGELAACQRYYTLWASGTAQPIGMGTYLNATQVNGTVALPVEMRTAPTISQVTGTNYYRASSGGGGNDDFNSLTLDTCSSRAVRYYNASEAAGTSGQAAVITTNNAASFLAFQAEL